MPKTIIIDIETAGCDFEALDELSKEYFLKYAEDEQQQKEAKESLSFYPLTAQVVAIGLSESESEKNFVIYQDLSGASAPMKERENIFVPAKSEDNLLKLFWSKLKEYRQIVTFNGRGFDCPFLMIRSAINEVKPSKNLMPNRYSSDVHIDLFDRLSFFGSVRKKFNLHMWCKAFNIASPKEGEVTGYQVKDLFNEGKYKEATEILDKLVYAEPKNQEAKDLLADCFEQLGYQQENPGLRNCFLTGANELRSGMSQELAASSMSLDLAKAMSTGLFFEYIGIMVDSKKAEGMEFTINLITPENGEKYIIEMSNATLTNIKGYQAKDADLTLTITRMGLAQAMTGKKTIKDQITDGDAKAEGDIGVLTQLASTLVHFSNDFEILPGTKTTKKKMDSEDYEVDFYEDGHE